MLEWEVDTVTRGRTDAPDGRAHGCCCCCCCCCCSCGGGPLLCWFSLFLSGGGGVVHALATTTTPLLLLLVLLRIIPLPKVEEVNAAAPESCIFASWLRGDFLAA